MNTVLPEAEYYASLPRKPCAAGVILTNEQGDVLILQTSFKSDWEVPGGGVEANESPLEAAVREVLEELGLVLDRTTLRLTTVDYKWANGTKSESFQMHFWGGVVDPTTIRVDGDEIVAFKFIPVAELDQYCSSTLARRTRETIVAAAEKRMVYLEDGYTVH